MGTAASSRGEELGFFTPEKPQPRDAEETRARLERWLARRRPEAEDLRLGPVLVPAANGVANETLLVDATWREGGVERTGGFVVRLATPEVLFPDGGIDVQRRMYEALADEPGVPVPAVVGAEHDPSVLDAPFFVMERVDGLVPSDRPHYSFEGWVAEATPQERQRLWRSAVAALAAVHAVPTDRVPFLDHPERGASGLDQALAYWRGYYEGDAPAGGVRVMEQGWEWLLAHRPADPVTGLAWGDARISNLIFRAFACVAVLDWDMVSLAGPETDLGWWILQDQGSARRLPGLGSLADTVDLWQELSGRTVTDLRWHVAFNAFRLGAIRMRLAHQMATHGERAATEALETNNVAIQQLALLLDLSPGGPVTASLPDIEL